MLGQSSCSSLFFLPVETGMLIANLIETATFWGRRYERENGLI
jgi:hypothetical protein